MKEKTLFIAISTQKGGIGKKALTVLLSSYPHYSRGYNMAVVDCDYPQYSINGMRLRDKKAVTEDPHYKSLFYKQSKTLNKRAYPIEVSRASEAIETAKKIVQESEIPLDFVFFDLPGTMNAKGVLSTLAQMDYIFTPITADRMVLESSLIQDLSMNRLLPPEKEISKVCICFGIWLMLGKAIISTKCMSK